VQFCSLSILVNDHLLLEYTRMANAIQKLSKSSGKPPFLFSLCQWGRVSKSSVHSYPFSDDHHQQEPWLWARRLGQSWRVSEGDSCSSVKTYIFISSTQTTNDISKNTLQSSFILPNLKIADPEWNTLMSLLNQFVISYWSPYHPIMIFSETLFMLGHPISTATTTWTL
jgi:hypothetical protein